MLTDDLCIEINGNLVGLVELSKQDFYLDGHPDTAKGKERKLVSINKTLFIEDDI
jgi:hypothetical protein